MNKFFNQNRSVVGIVAGLGSVLLVSVLVAVVLLLLGQPMQGNVRWFALAFLPIVFILRYYVRRGDCLAVVKSLLTVLFVTFIAFITFYLKY